MLNRDSNSPSDLKYGRNLGSIASLRINASPIYKLTVPDFVTYAPLLSGLVTDVLLLLTYIILPVFLSS